MKVILASLNAKYIHSNLAIRYIRAFSKEYQIDVYDTSINDNPMDIAVNIALKQPDIIGFSCYIWNIENTLKVCAALKEIDRDIRIILGGPEVSFDGTEYLEKYDYIDYIIQGEGEIPFKNLLDALNTREKDLKNIDGLIYRSEKEIIKNSPQGLIENLDIIPFPYEDGIPDKIVYYEASRGCPFNCKYCLSSTIKGVRFFSLERVKRDLKRFIDSEIKIVKFVDRTFNANKKFSMEIWKFLIENHVNTKFHFEIAADILDEDSIELLKKAPEGLFQFEIGVQTTNPEILKNINRIMDFESVKENILKIQNEGKIHCHMDLIAGLPGEDLNSFKNSFNKCMEIKPDVLQLGFLKILKGSPMYFEINKYDIHYMPYPPYQVVATLDLPFLEMVKLLEMEEVFEAFYNSGIFKISMFYMLSNLSDSYQLFYDFTQHLKSRDFFNRSFSIHDKFKEMFDFSRRYFDEGIMKDILMHDFIINSKKSNLPEFLNKSFTGELKEKIYENREKIEKTFGCFDIKRFYYTLTAVRVEQKGRIYDIAEEEKIVVFNLKEDEHMYI